jgi:hypothetical protein
MSLGKSDIPDLRLERLQGLISSFMASPTLVLSKMFGAGTNEESDTIKWESQIGNRGMTPFVAPGAPSPTVAPTGLTPHSAASAYWKEKMPLDEVFLNNLRQPGTTAVYMTAAQRLARETLMMRNRCDRRKEWMFAQMLSAGSFSYDGVGGVKLSVDYGVPTAQIVSLAATRYWDTGSQRNIVEDIFDAKLALQNAIGAQIDWGLCTTEVLKLMIMDKSIQTLLAKSAFGDGDLFTRPVEVLRSLLGLPNFMVYDEQYVVTGWLTAVVTGASTTTIYVDDVTDFVAGGTIRFHDTSAGTYEDETIATVVPASGYLTISTAPTASFKAGEDKVSMTKKFLPTTKFCMFSSTVEGQKIAEYHQAPFGLGRHYGLYVDRHDEWDPDVTWVRVQNKGLPVLKNRDALYILTVKA